MSTRYVAGFLFSLDQKHVLLIHKLRPEWQKGKWNGIGGKIESGESGQEAMIREFREETGLTIPNWRHFCTLYVNRCEILFFSATGPVFLAESKEEEKVGVFPVDQLQNNIIPNLKWLIPMALDEVNAEVQDFR
jgi:8-oxo-dGTP diphosphatase